MNTNDLSPEEREQKIEALRRFIADYRAKAEAAWWSGTKRDCNRIADAACREILNLGGGL
jgi:hypothetical protein